MINKISTDDFNKEQFVNSNIDKKALDVKFNLIKDKVNEIIAQLPQNINNVELPIANTATLGFLFFSNGLLNTRTKALDANDIEPDALDDQNLILKPSLVEEENFTADCVGSDVVQQSSVLNYHLAPKTVLSKHIKAGSVTGDHFFGFWDCFTNYSAECFPMQKIENRSIGMSRFTLEGKTALYDYLESKGEKQYNTFLGLKKLNFEYPAISEDEQEYETCIFTSPIDKRGKDVDLIVELQYTLTIDSREIKRFDQHIFRHLTKGIIPNSLQQWNIISVGGEYYGWGGTPIVHCFLEKNLNNNKKSNVKLKVILGATTQYNNNNQIIMRVFFPKNHIDIPLEDDPLFFEKCEVHLELLSGFVHNNEQNIIGTMIDDFNTVVEKSSEISKMPDSYKETQTKTFFSGGKKNESKLQKEYTQKKQNNIEEKTVKKTIEKKRDTDLLTLVRPKQEIVKKEQKATLKKINKYIEYEEKKEYEDNANNKEIEEHKIEKNEETQETRLHEKKTVQEQGTEVQVKQENEINITNNTGSIKYENVKGDQIEFLTDAQNDQGVLKMKSEETDIVLKNNQGEDISGKATYEQIRDANSKKEKIEFVPNQPIIKNNGEKIEKVIYEDNVFKNNGEIQKKEKSIVALDKEGNVVNAGYSSNTNEINTNYIGKDEKIFEKNQNLEKTPENILHESIQDGVLRSLSQNLEKQSDLENFLAPQGQISLPDGNEEADKAEKLLQYFRENSIIDKLEMSSSEDSKNKIIEQSQTNIEQVESENKLIKTEEKQEKEYSSVPKVQRGLEQLQDNQTKMLDEIDKELGKSIVKHEAQQNELNIVEDLKNYDLDYDPEIEGDPDFNDSEISDIISPEENKEIEEDFKKLEDKKEKIINKQEEVTNLLKEEQKELEDYKKDKKTPLQELRQQLTDIREQIQHNKSFIKEEKDETTKITHRLIEKKNVIGLRRKKDTQKMENPVTSDELITAGSLLLDRLHNETRPNTLKKLIKQAAGLREKMIKKILSEPGLQKATIARGGDGLWVPFIWRHSYPELFKDVNVKNSVEVYQYTQGQNKEIYDKLDSTLREVANKWGLNVKKITKQTYFDVADVSKNLNPKLKRILEIQRNLDIEATQQNFRLADKLLQMPPLGKEKLYAPKTVSDALKQQTRELVGTPKTCYVTLKCEKKYRDDWLYIQNFARNNKVFARNIAKLLKNKVWTGLVGISVGEVLYVPETGSGDHLEKIYGDSIPQMVNLTNKYKYIRDQEEEQQKKKRTGIENNEILDPKVSLSTQLDQNIIFSKEDLITKAMLNRIKERVKAGGDSLAFADQDLFAAESDESESISTFLYKGKIDVASSNSSAFVGIHVETGKMVFSAGVKQKFYKLEYLTYDELPDTGTQRKARLSELIQDKNREYEIDLKLGEIETYEVSTRNPLGAVIGGVVGTAIGGPAGGKVGAALGGGAGGFIGDAVSSGKRLELARPVIDTLQTIVTNPLDIKLTYSSESVRATDIYTFLGRKIHFTIKRKNGEMYNMEITLTDDLILYGQKTYMVTNLKKVK